jgi:hypothetical protein
VLDHSESLINDCAVDSGMYTNTQVQWKTKQIGSHGRAVSAASALPGQNNALADHYNGRRRAKALKPRFLTLTTGIRSSPLMAFSYRELFFGGTTFCCCLRVRLGVIIMTALGMLLAGLLSILLWFEVACELPSGCASLDLLLLKLHRTCRAKNALYSSSQAW